MKKAFTLAEVLITLGIIGVVAAMTMPSLIQSYKEKATVTQLKKVYSILNNALLMATNEYGTVDEWGLTNNNSADMSGAITFIKRLAENLSSIKNCKNDGGCFYNGTYKTLSEKNEAFNGLTPNFGTFTIADGTSIAVWIQNQNCSNGGSCGSIFVDLNGKKNPNTTGKDAFWFHIYKNRIVPYGTKDDVYRFKTCIYDDSSYTSRSCTAWVIFNENMDYLHCEGLSWDGKTKCK